MKNKLDNKRLKKNFKKKQQKYLLLLTNQIVIVGTEFGAMKIKNKRFKNATVAEFMPTFARINSGVTGLSKLIESLNDNQNK